MSNYTKTTPFAVKDGYTTGNPLKIVRGTEIDAEFDAIQTAVNSKADTASPVLTGSPTVDDGGDLTCRFGISTLEFLSTGFGWGNATLSAASFRFEIGGVEEMRLDTSGNLLIGGTTAGTSSVGTLHIFNGTAPTGSATDGVILYSEDVSASAELKVRDEAGNTTTLSPHNFSLIPDGPSEDLAWAYYSEKDGKRINVDMLKLARMVEELTGEKLVYEA